MATNNYKADAWQSRIDFESFGREALQRFFQSDQIIPVDGQATRLEKSLDRMHGIDALIVGKDGGLYAVAYRFQHTRTYSAFSPRRTRANGSRTEFEKYVANRQAGTATVDFIMQGFVDDDDLTATIGIAPMDDVAEYCSKHPNEYKTNRSDNSTFYVAPWRAIKPTQYTIRLPF